jgi:hypothetical protein
MNTSTPSTMPPVRSSATAAAPSFSCAPNVT